MMKVSQLIIYTISNNKTRFDIQCLAVDRLSYESCATHTVQSLDYILISSIVNVYNRSSSGWSLSFKHALWYRAFFSSARWQHASVAADSYNLSSWLILYMCIDISLFDCSTDFQNSSPYHVSFYYFIVLRLSGYVTIQFYWFVTFLSYCLLFPNLLLVIFLVSDFNGYLSFS